MAKQAQATQEPINKAETGAVDYVPPIKDAAPGSAQLPTMPGKFTIPPEMREIIDAMDKRSQEREKRMSNEPQNNPAQESSKNNLTTDAGEEYEFPEEIANRSEKTKNSFRIALDKERKKIEERLQKELEAKIREELDKKYGEQYTQTLSELENKLKEREKLIEESQQILSLVAVEKTPEFRELTAQIDAYEKEIFDYAESLGIERATVKTLLTGDAKDRAKAKVQVRKDHDVDGEAFLEFIEEYSPRYREAHSKREELVAKAREFAEQRVKEDTERSRWEQIRAQQEIEKKIEQYSRLTSEYVAKSVLASTDDDLIRDIQKSTIETVRRITSNKDEAARSLETLAIISENEALSRKIAGMSKELSDMRKKLESAGIGSIESPDRASKSSGTSAGNVSTKITSDDVEAILEKFKNKNPWQIENAPYKKPV